MKQMKRNKKVREYPETHQQGILSMESNGFGANLVLQGDFGVQIAEDGRVWICVDGKAFLRFKPNIEGGKK